MLATSCSSAVAEDALTTESRTASGTPCEQAWATFATIDDMHDTLSDAVPTLFACPTLSEWLQAGNRTPGDTLIVARVTAENLCRYQESAKNAPLCQSLR